VEVTEYDRRLEAVGRVGAGETVVVAASLSRTERRLHKSLRHYEARGESRARGSLASLQAPSRPDPRTWSLWA
jgi:hypothetical protein